MLDWIDRPPRDYHVPRADLYHVRRLSGRIRARRHRHFLRLSRRLFRRLQHGPVREPAAAHLRPGAWRTRFSWPCPCSSSWALSWRKAEWPRRCCTACRCCSAVFRAGLRHRRRDARDDHGGDDRHRRCVGRHADADRVAGDARARLPEGLSVGAIASAGTLGILIPPSIMLVIMGDLMQIPVGTLFAAAIIPGLVMSVRLHHLHRGPLFSASRIWRRRSGRTRAPRTPRELWEMVHRSSRRRHFSSAGAGLIFGGWATPTEAAGVGSAAPFCWPCVSGRLN